MSLDISQINNQSSLQQTAAARSDGAEIFPQQQHQQLHPTIGDKPAATSDSDKVAIDASRTVPAERLQRIADSAAERESLAMGVRRSDAALDAANAQVKAMKAKLAKIVKNYPPFALDDKERMELLRSFVSLRKEIDSMTIPPPPLQPGEQLTGSVWRKEGLTELLPGQLAVDASDEEVKNAHDKLGDAAQAIGEGRQELRKTVLSMR